MSKKLAFRLFAILLGLAPLVAAEVVCRAFDWGRPTSYDDPYVGFSDIHPLFVLNEATGQYEIPRSRHTHFRPESFAAEKPVGEFRIFVLGGSTVQGHPYAIQTSFTSWLELSLRAAQPERSWRVVNCGGISYASYRLVPILQEVLQYEPDMVIFCEGHNEFLEDRSYDHIKHAPAVLSWLQRQTAQLRTYTLLRAWVRSPLTPSLSPPGGEGKGVRGGVEQQTLDRNRPKLGPEVDARLDWTDGMKKYHRDEAWQRGVIDHFEFNLRRMVDIAAGAKAPLWFMVPVSNLDWPPFKSEHRAGLSEADKSRFDQLLASARQQYNTDLPAALDSLQKAARIDDQYAVIHYELGKCYQQLGMIDEAKAALQKACDLDICPLRMLSTMRARMIQVAQETGTPLFDADELLKSQSADGITGAQWLADHVHPTIEGHQLWAEKIVEAMTKRGLVQPQPDWQAARQRLYDEHMATLQPNYFSRGREVLLGTLRWAYGKVTKDKK